MVTTGGGFDPDVATMAITADALGMCRRQCRDRDR
jgi:hypothetical protein